MPSDHTEGFLFSVKKEPERSMSLGIRWLCCQSLADFTIQSATAKQLVVSSLVNNAPLVQHHNAVGLFCCSQIVSNLNHRCGQLVNCLLERHVSHLRVGFLI